MIASPEIDTRSAEIVRNAHKLWQRQYVDGNGGNLSVRLSDGTVLCTPTLVSKGDLLAEDLCVVDLDGNMISGTRPRTSEVLLHLEIYKANPQATAVVHCHPPYATAWAVTGQTPPTGYISEYEIFVGPAAMAPYETPGTAAFARTVRPFAALYNTIFLQNHGIVCWAESVTRAEWLVEVVETYCHTLHLARQIGQPLQRIPDDKIAEILALKQRMGLPDARLAQPHIAHPVSDELRQMADDSMARCANG